MAVERKYNGTYWEEVSLALSLSLSLSLSFIESHECEGCNSSLATVEMHLILARVPYNFDLELMPESENWTDQKIFIVWQKRPLMVRLRAARR
jgi:hypothetical protein